MRALAIVFAVLFSSQLFAQATMTQKLNSVNPIIDISRVKRSILLERNQAEDLEVRLVLIYLGQQLDPAPKYAFYITYFNGGQTNNIRTAFNLGYFMDYVSDSSSNQGLFTITATIFDKNSPNNEKQVTMDIDMTQVYKDDNAVKAKAAKLTDPYFKSTITVTAK